MRIVILLIVLAIIGLLSVRELQSPAPSPDTSVQQNANNAEQPPSVPVKAGDVKDFKKEMNDFVDKQDQQRKRRIEQATGNGTAQ